MPDVKTSLAELALGGPHQRPLMVSAGCSTLCRAADQGKSLILPPLLVLFLYPATKQQTSCSAELI